MMNSCFNLSKPRIAQAHVIKYAEHSESFFGRVITNTAFELFTRSNDTPIPINMVTITFTQNQSLMSICSSVKQTNRTNLPFPNAIILLLNIRTEKFYMNMNPVWFCPILFVGKHHGYLPNAYMCTTV